MRFTDGVCDDCSNPIENHNDLVCSLRARITNLEAAARSLRAAQKNYMANRGNQEAGKAVAVAAKELDRVLGDV
jgi:hypothetical protein